MALKMLSLYMAQKRTNIAQSKDLSGDQAGKTTVTNPFKNRSVTDPSSSSDMPNPFKNELHNSILENLTKQRKPTKSDRKSEVSEEENAKLLQANEVRKRLIEKHGIVVRSVETNKEFYSETLIKKSISEDKREQYFISLEDPVLTGKITDYLIGYNNIKREVDRVKNYDRKLELLEIAHEKRTEKSIQIAHDVSPKIAEITKQYCAANNGKEPSLHKLAELLNEAKIPAPGGSQSKWYAQTVKRVLNTEKPGHSK